MTRPPLVGREHEQQIYAAALADPDVTTIAIRAPAGQGKSALTEQARRLSGPRTWVGAGKHAEGAGGRDARPLGQALSQVLDAALDDLSDPAAGLGALRDRMGALHAALAPLDIAGLGAGGPEPGALLNAEVAVDRVALAVVRLLVWLCGFQRPIVLILDDWGRASSATRDLYGRIAQSAGAGVTIVGSERISEPSDIKADVRIDLPPLRQAAFEAIAANALDDDRVAAAAVIEVLGAPPDSPLHLVQVLAALKASGALQRYAGGWALDRSAAAVVLGKSATEALVDGVRRASPDAWRLAKGLAVFGDRAAIDDLAAATEVSASEAVTVLGDPAAGAVFVVHAQRIAFPHDTIRAAVLAGIDGAERASIASRWAEHLRDRSSLQGSLLEVALRLRLEAGLAQADAGRWASTFVSGAGVMRAVGAAGQARAFASAAMELESRIGQASFAAAREAALTALQAGDLTAAVEFSQVMRARHAGEQERAAAAEIEVLAERMAGRPKEALAIGAEALSAIASTPNVPRRVTQPGMIAAVIAMRLSSGGGPAVTGDFAAGDRLLNTVGALAFELDPPTAVVMAACTASHPRLRSGAYAASLRTLLSCLSGDWAGAVRHGHETFRRLDGDVLRAPAMQIALQFGVGLELSAEEALAAARRLEVVAIEDGDAGVASYAVRDKALSSMRTRAPLTAHRAMLAECRAAACRFDDRATAPLIDALDQMAVNFLGGSDEPWRLQGDIFDAPRFQRAAEGEMERVAMASMTLEALLANAFGAWETTAAVWERMDGRFNALKHHPVCAFWSFHTGLARARLGQPMARWERAGVEREARFNPRTFRHRALALRAEEALRRGRSAQGFALYEAAVSEADAAGARVEHGVVASAALAAAKAARRDDLAERFHRAAQSAWGQWGATALCEGRDAPEPPDEAPAAVEFDTSRQTLAAERASRAKTRLLAEAAHELRSPMQGIQSLLDLAAEEPDSMDVQQMRNAFSGMRGVVDDITDLSALEADALSLLPAPFDPADLARGELSLLAARAEKAGRGLHFAQRGAALGPVLGDAGRVGQVLRNLLTNALNYADGPVLLTLGTDGDDGVMFEVSDRGPGLSAADHARLFQPFARGDASVRAAGSGLGLALSRRLAERMGGALIAEDREGGGVTFRFSARCPPAPRVAPSAAGRPLRVLLAEDVDLARDSMVRLLERRGHRVTAVADGRQAVQACLSETFDILVLDALMPELGGPEALAEIRGRGLQTPALVLSASVSDALGHSLSTLAPVRLLRKPLTADMLETVLQEIAPGEVSPPPASGHIDVEAAAALSARLRVAEQALARGDFQGARQAAHAAAGLAAQLGMPATDAAFSEAERAALAEQTDRLAAALGKLCDLETRGFEPVNAL